MHEPFGPQQLVIVGNALYGRSWQSDMARAIGMSDARRIRYWVKGEREIPIGVWRDLAELLRHRGIYFKIMVDDMNTVLRSFDQQTPGATR